MHRFFCTLALVLVATPFLGAEDSKAPLTAEQLRKQIAETEALLSSKKTELAKAQAVLASAEAEYKQVKDLGLDRLKGADIIAKLLIENTKPKAVEAWQAAEKATLAAKIAARTARVLEDKIKDSSDTKEIEQLKKKLAEAEAAAKKSIEEARKAQTAAKEAADALEEAQKEAFLQRKAVVDLQDTAMREITKTVLNARVDVLKIQEELVIAERALRELKEKLKRLEK